MSRDKLRALEELQKVDLQIRDLAALAEQHPQRLKQIEGERNQTKAALDALRGKLADNERARRQQTELLALEKEKERKWESRQGELKTQREFAALSRELDILKKTNLTAQAELQRLTAEYEDLKKGLGAAEVALADKEAVVQREGQQIQVQLQALQQQTQALQAQRAVAVTACEAGLVAKYERIRQKRGGVGVAPVIRGTCKGCQMNIPPQMANLLRTGAEIQTCPSCHRFIYAAVDPTPEPAPEPA